MTVKHLYPNSTPALNLNFKSSGVADPRLSCVRNSVGTYVDPVSGLIKTAAAHEARVGKDGLVVEEERTNLFTNSIWNFNNDAATNIVKTQNSTDIAAPDGTFTATHVTADYINWLNSAFPAASTQTIGSLTYSYWIYPVSIDKNQGANNAVEIRVTASVSGERGPVWNPIIPLELNRWQRITATINNTDGTGNIQPSMIRGCSNVDVHVWGFQLEVGDFMTSLIPTSGSTVQRLADEVTLTNSGIFNPNQNTIINEDFGVAGGSDTLTIVGNGSKAERTLVYNSHLSQTNINAVADKTDDWWEWRVLGSSFGLPDFTTDGQVSVDWGDGTAVGTLTTSDHTFTNGSGYHIIKFRLDSGTYFTPKVADGTHKNKVISVGPCPDSMIVRTNSLAYRCANLETFDSRLVLGGPANINRAWRECTSLLNVPCVDTSAITNFSEAWYGCSSLTSFPLLDVSSGTDFENAWKNCSGLTSFPLLDVSSGTSFRYAWDGCSGLTSFPVLDVSSSTKFNYAWRNCSSLTSFPSLDVSSGTKFFSTWRGCTGLTSFPQLDIPSSTTFSQAWYGCSNLISFPANFFDSWSGTPDDECFLGTWDNCTALSSTSVENILNSIDTSGQSAPSTDPDITIDYNTGTGTPNISTAVTNLKNRNWTITLNGVLQ